MKHSLNILSRLTLMALVLGATEAYAQQPTFEARFSKDSIEVGDQVEYILDIKADRATVLGMPDFGEVVSNADREKIRRNISTYKTYDEDQLEIIKDYPIDTISEDGRTLHLRKRYRLAAMETGALNLQPAVLYFPKNSEQPDTLYADYKLTLNVASYAELDTLNFMSNNAFAAPGAMPAQGAMVDTTLVNQLVKREGIMEMQDMPFIDEELEPKPQKSYWMVAAIIATVILLGVIAYFVWRHLRRRGVVGSVEVLLPPHIEANKALEELHHRKLWQNGKYNLYYTLLTDILRRYISRRWDIRAMEYTSDEIMAALRGCEMSVDSRANLSTIFRTADMAKFAKAEPDDELNEECYTMAYYFVENTKLINEHEVEGKNDITIDTKIGE